MRNKASVDIAGTVFRFSSDMRGPVSFLRNKYSVFLSSAKPDVDVELRLNKRWKARARNIEAPLVSESGEILSLQTKFFDMVLDFRKSQARLDARPDVGMTDVARFLCSVFLTRRKGFLLHASSIIHNGNAYIFFGPSGSGKTTIARLSDGDILSDETTAIDLRRGRFMAYATPFSGEFDGVKKNSSSQVKALFLLKKGGEFRHERMGRRKAFQGLFESVMMPFASSGVAENLFVTFGKLINMVSCSELYFKPERSIWRYIDECAG